MTENKLFEYYETSSVDEFINYFNTHINSSKKPKKLTDEKTKDVRSLFFEVFATKEFKEIYERLALELAEQFEIDPKNFLIQSTPTPRVFRPGDHGTSWHTDFWYGHGVKSKTVWVPIKNVMPGSTFSVVKNKSENSILLDFYENHPELLTKEFEYPSMFVPIPIVMSI